MNSFRILFALGIAAAMAGCASYGDGYAGNGAYAYSAVPSDVTVIDTNPVIVERNVANPAQASSGMTAQSATSKQGSTAQQMQQPAASAPKSAPASGTAAKSQPSAAPKQSEPEGSGTH